MAAILASPSLPSFNAGRPNLRPDLVPLAFCPLDPRPHALADHGRLKLRLRAAARKPPKIDLLAGRLEGRVGLRASLCPDRHAFRDKRGLLVFLTSDQWGAAESSQRRSRRCPFVRVPSTARRSSVTTMGLLWQTDFTYLKVIGWGWYYLFDYSRYITAWKLCTTMRADDVTDTLELALVASGCDSAMVVHKPRLLSDNGSSYISSDLAEWLKDRGIAHVRGAPCHPQTQGKIERWHQTSA